MIVFLKTSEEANTWNGEDLKYTYVNPSMEITSLESSFAEVNF